MVFHQLNAIKSWENMLIFFNSKDECTIILDGCTIKPEKLTLVKLSGIHIDENLNLVDTHRINL